jgi:DNA-binding winged helix-turn-helix (wHTH) protein
MEQAERVDLAHVPSFRLGRLVVTPAVHQVKRDDGAEEVLQHRVMQVLVALARADGAIVTRDELTTSCWDGRVVGEDAINRILSRLRSVASGIGAGSFRIETVTRVGYRLLREGQAAPEAAPEGQSRNRRAVLLGGAALAASGAAAGLYFMLRESPDEASPPGEVAPLWARAVAALHQGTPQANEQALGLLRQIVERAPDFADGWGALGVAFAMAWSGTGERTGDDSARRAQAAIQHARALDPGNAYAAQAEIALLRITGAWADVETRTRRALERHPRHFGLIGQLGWILWQVGRLRESLVQWEQMVALDQASPLPRLGRAAGLWAGNRLEEADRAFREDLELFPFYPAIWFGRFEFLLVSGRIPEALGQLDNQADWPPGIPRSEFTELRQAALALQSPESGAIDAVMRLHLEKARRGTGFAEVAIKYASLFGRLDDAFTIAEAFFFARGFDPGDVRYTAEQAIRDPRRDRRTHFLFLPSTASLRADPRFERLVTEIGLARYWAETRIAPDYRRR